tara:strand:+ start:657 stop:1295 length:639 start_codon:yes stop_codon:yes gene_type:complete
MIQDYSKFINDCLEKSKTEHLPKEITKISDDTKPHSMSTHRTQALLNNLCSFGDARYLEIGILDGASYFAAAFENSGQFYGIDDWSKYGDRMQNIRKNILSFSTEKTQFHFFNEDSWKLDLSKIKHKINVFFYDGDHSKEAQEKYLKHFDEVLDEDVILIVDDFFNSGIKFSMEEATKKCIENSSFKVQFEKKLLEKHTWHEGFYIAHLKRI